MTKPKKATKRRKGQSASKAMLGSTALTKAQIARVEEWWDKVNQWEMPDGFRVRILKTGDKRDHYRVMFDVISSLRVAFSLKPNAEVSGRPHHETEKE